ncbi:peptidoglycan DD-metalloendopeptidase family protein [Porphyromonadaceae bacterium OttesenSCG-928-L07]|nr:peptidoglycan DD-metalloendopeptidase family protein [Porphyromonadaceae bacterium OttesenSCG-928-L07]
MKKWNAIVLFLLFSITVSAQSINAIKKEKERSEKEIAYLNKLLGETANSKSASLNKLNILQEKILQSKKLLNTLHQEVSYQEKIIAKNEKKRTELLEKKEAMMDMYSKLIYGLWKKRDNTNKLMFIFSSSDFNQAYKRYKYFEQIQSYSKKQLAVIEQINDSLYYRNQEIKKYVEQKNTTLKEINQQNRELIIQQSNENGLIRELQKKEKEITKKLNNEQKNRNRLTNELNKLIAAQTKKSGSSSTQYKLTPEEKIISEDFSKNKGKLPWPVTQGIISEKFGINQHPVYSKVKMVNNGISITTSKNVEVRAIFKGVVSEILFMPGFNNVIIIRHGNYLTVYSNLIDVRVKKGQTVDTKETIGKVAYDEDKGSIINFQVWHNTEKQNPEFWLAK